MNLGVAYGVVKDDLDVEYVMRSDWSAPDRRAARFCGADRGLAVDAGILQE